MPFAGLPTALKVPGDFGEPLSVPQYDTPLKLERVSSELQRHFGVGTSESVVFERLQHGYGRYSDGIKFAIGKEISLQSLGSGVTIITQRPSTSAKMFSN